MCASLVQRRVTEVERSPPFNAAWPRSNEVLHSQQGVTELKRFPSRTQAFVNFWNRAFSVFRRGYHSAHYFKATWECEMVEPWRDCLLGSREGWYTRTCTRVHPSRIGFESWSLVTSTTWALDSLWRSRSGSLHTHTDIGVRLAPLSLQGSTSTAVDELVDINDPFHLHYWACQHFLNRKRWAGLPGV